jgi:hypothetical protein
VTRISSGKDLNGRVQRFTFLAVDKVAGDGCTDWRAGFFVWNVSKRPNLYKFERSLHRSRATYRDCR